MIKDTVENEEIENPDNVQLIRMYRSTFAKQIDDELKLTANKGTEKKGGRQDNSNMTEPQLLREQWEEIKPKQTKVPRVRKPVILKDWFGQKIDELSDSSSSSQGEDQEWSQIERKNANIRKKTEINQKIKDKMKQLSTRMQYMVGIGPIHDDSIEYFIRRNQDREQAEKSAVREHLSHFLDYNNDEIEAIDIIETKRAKKDDVIYCVLGWIEDVKEIHFRKAASGNQDLLTRDFIPPQLHSRYMAVVKKAPER